MLVNILIIGCIAGFIGLFGMVIYFRVRVLLVYQKLVRNRIQFEPAHIFNKKRLQEEILPKYPEHQKIILTYVNGIRLSTTMVSVFMVIITACAAGLMFIKN